MTIDMRAPRAGVSSLLDRWNQADSSRARLRRDLGLAVLVILGTTLVLLPLRDVLGVLNLMFAFLVASLALGLIVDYRVTVLGAIVSFLVCDFFFVPPYVTLTIADRDHLVALFAYLAVSGGESWLVARLRDRTFRLERESRRTSVLYDLNRRLLRDFRLERLLPTISRSVVEVYGARGCRIILLDTGDTLHPTAPFPDGIPLELTREEEAMTRWVIEHRTVAALGTGRVRVRTPYDVAVHRSGQGRRRPGPRLFVPVMSQDQVRAVLEIQGRPGGGDFGSEDERILVGFADTAALALERADLIERSTRAAALEEADQLKSALLASVSHDLRTPLTAIKASATSLMDESVSWTAEDRAELLGAIDEEVDRLSLMVSNLLDMSRIEGGALHPDIDWYDVQELVGDVTRRTARYWSAHHFDVDIRDVSLIRADWVFLSQVLMNVLNNAAKYAPAGTRVALSVRPDGDDVVFCIQDQGPGIPRDLLPRIFERFFRAPDAGAVPGAGLGLSISRGLIEAMGGSIRADSVEGEGTTVTIRIPRDDR